MSPRVINNLAANKAYIYRSPFSAPPPPPRRLLRPTATLPHMLPNAACTDTQVCSETRDGGDERRLHRGNGRGPLPRLAHGSVHPAADAAGAGSSLCRPRADGLSGGNSGDTVVWCVLFATTGLMLGDKGGGAVLVSSSAFLLLHGRLRTARVNNRVTLRFMPYDLRLSRHECLRNSMICLESQELTTP